MQNAIITILMLTATLFGVDSEARMHIEKRDYNHLWSQAFISEQAELPNVPYRDVFIKAAKQYDLHPMLLMAVARGESNFNNSAQSSALCAGVMQLKWKTGQDMGIIRKADLYDPAKNIMAGAKYLRYLLDMHNGNVHRALAAYNYGPGRVHAKLPDYRLTSGMRWYSGYIYYHLTRLQDGTGYDPAVKGRIPLMAFDDPDRADAIIAHLKRVEGIRLDCARVEDGRTAIVLVYNSNSEKRSALRKLRVYGMTRNG